MSYIKFELSRSTLPSAATEGLRVGYADVFDVLFVHVLSHFIFNKSRNYTKEFV